MSSVTTSASNGETLAHICYVRHEKNKSFDLKYYVDKHLPLVVKWWTQYGMKGWEVVQYPEDDPNGIFVEGILRFESKEGVEKAFATLFDTPELVDDIEHYYPDRPEDIPFLQRRVGKVLGKSD